MGAGSIDNKDVGRLSASAAWQERERQIKAFEDAWQSGQEPQIDDYVKSESSVRIALLIELVHVDLEIRIQSGRQARAESYVSRFPELDQDANSVIELLAAECMLRQRHCGTVEVSE